MIQVHHLNNSRSQRVLWLLEELGLDYEVIRYERDTATMRAPKELQKIHPLGKSPVIVDQGRVLAESGAIIEYLVETYGQGRLVPTAGSEERRRYTYWLHYAEGSAMPLLLLKLVFLRMPKGAPALLRPIVRGIAAKAQAGLVDPQLETHMTYWADTLRAQDGWFTGGEFSAADIQMSFPLEAATARAELKPHHQPIRDFLARIHARPAYQRVLERGGPYTLLK